MIVEGAGKHKIIVKVLGDAINSNEVSGLGLGALFGGVRGYGYYAHVKSTFKPVVAFVAGGMILSLVSLVVWISANRNIDGLMFGHVVRVAPSSLVIVDRDNRPTTVLIATGTTIVDRQQEILPATISVGQFLQVTGTRLHDQRIRATTIRLMRSPRPDRLHEAQ